MAINWKICDIDLKNVGTGDSVEVTHMTITAYDSDGAGATAKREQENISWVPKNSIYYADSATARAVAQTAAFDDWIELDSEHTAWMERLQWGIKTRLWRKDHEMSDSYKITKSIQLTDSAEVVNPLGL